MSASEPQVMSALEFLVRGGGAYLLGIGLLISIWGTRELLRPRSQNRLLLLALASLLPGLLALIDVYAASTELTEMAAVDTAPKPKELMAVIGSAISSGFCGIVGLMVPVLVSIAALWRLNAQASAALVNEPGRQ